MGSLCHTRHQYKRLSVCAVVVVNVLYVEQLGLQLIVVYIEQEHVISRFNENPYSIRQVFFCFRVVDAAGTVVVLVHLELAQSIQYNLSTAFKRSSASIEQNRTN